MKKFYTKFYCVNNPIQLGDIHAFVDMFVERSHVPIHLQILIPQQQKKQRPEFSMKK